MSDASATYIHPAGGEGDGWTYLIQGRPGSPVKIGSTRRSPLQRLAALQTANPDLLTFAGVFAGRERERELHERFADRRIRGEWFKPEILDEIDWTDVEMAS